MAQLQSARKKRVIVALIMHLQIVNLSTLLLMSICAVLLADRLGKKKMKKRIRHGGHCRAMIRGVNFNSIEDENGEEIDSTETQQDTHRVAEVDQANGSNKKGKKRARTEHGQSHMLCEIIDRFGGYVKGISDSIAELASCFKHEAEHAKRRMSIPEEIKKVPGLTLHEWLKASMAIMKEPNLIDLFMQVEPDMKKLIIDIVLGRGTGN